MYWRFRERPEKCQTAHRFAVLTETDTARAAQPPHRAVGSKARDAPRRHPAPDLFAFAVISSSAWRIFRMNALLERLERSTNVSRLQAVL